MICYRFRDVTRYAAVYRATSNLHKKNYCENVPQKSLDPVKLAYSSYELTEENKIGLEEKSPVFIMHGLLGSKNNWNSLSKHIHSRTKRKVIAVDARNHGDSPHTMAFNYPLMAADMHTLMTDLSIDKATTIGHSMGGRAMMFLALTYPDIINSLVVVDISPLRNSSAILQMTQLFDAMLCVEIEQGIPMSKARKVVDEQLKEVIPDNHVRQFILTNLVEVEGGNYKWRVNLESLIANFPDVVNFFLPPNKYRGPVLFIGGGNSPFLKPEDHEDILRFFPQAQFEYIKGAGHWVHSEKPKEFLKLVCEFINEN